MQIRTRLLTCLGFGLLTLSSAASAESLPSPGARVDEPIRYEFEDDDLLGDAFLSDGDLIRYRARPARTLLLRPRISFVTEMKQSIEHL